MKASQLLDIFKELDLDDSELREILSASSDVASQMLESCRTKKENEQTHFISAIKQVKQLPPPQTEKYAYCANIEITLDMDFNEYTTDPKKFNEALGKELAQFAFQKYIG